MGMTDRQFDTFIMSHLRTLIRIQKELANQGVKNEELDTMIKELQDGLKRP